MAIAASFILGGIVGLIPLLLGLMLKQAGLGRVGFLFCVFLGFRGAPRYSRCFGWLRSGNCCVVASETRSGPDINLEQDPPEKD